MKKVFVALFVLGSLSVFANTEFNLMSIKEIYQRGYMLEATVSQELGIRFTAGEQIAAIGTVSGNENDICLLKLKRAPEHDSILKMGSKFRLEAIGKGFVGPANDGLYSRKSTTIEGIDYRSDKSPSLEDLQKWCDRVTFSVIENDYLEVIKP